MSSGRVDKTEFPLELTVNIFSQGRDRLPLPIEVEATQKVGVELCMKH